MDFITPWLLKLPFDVAHEANKYRDDIIKVATTNPKDKYLFRYDNQDLIDYLYPRWIDLIEENFHVSGFHPDKEFRLKVLVQNNDVISISPPTGAQVFHNHMRCSINTAFYLTPPTTPTFEVIDPDSSSDMGCNTKRVVVEENYLYCMPNWLYHRINKQDDERYRITINMEYYTAGFVFPKIKQEKFERPAGGLSGHNTVWSSSWA